MVDWVVGYGANLEDPFQLQIISQFDRRPGSDKGYPVHHVTLLLFQFQGRICENVRLGDLKTAIMI